MDIKIFGKHNKSSGGDTTNPSDVTGLAKGTVTNDAIPLSWNAASDNVGVTNYEIWESEDGGAYSLKTTLGVVLSYANTGLTENTPYAYKVKAKDAAGNTSTNFSGIVTDTTLYDDQTAPTLNSITIEDANPTNVVMVFDEAVSGTNLGFTIGGTTSTTFASISGSGTTWTGVLGVDAAFGETITLSYASGTGDFKDGSNNDLASITNQAVTNNVADLYGPELFDATIATLSGTVTADGSQGLICTAVAHADYFYYQAAIADVGKDYKIEFEIYDWSSSSVTFQQPHVTSQENADGTYSYEATATAVNISMRNIGAGGTYKLRNVSVKEVL